MTIDTNTIVSVTEANQNFSRVTRILKKYKAAGSNPVPATKSPPFSLENGGFSVHLERFHWNIKGDYSIHLSTQRIKAAV